MKPTQLLALSALSLLAMSHSCKKEAETTCPAQTIDTTTVTGWDYNTACFGPAYAGQAQTYVINSVAELQALNKCATAPTIDFTRYTLLVGKSATSACSFVQSQRFTQQTCDAYTYQVKIADAPCQKPNELIYCVLVPKLPAGAQVTFDVQPAR